jgi:TonB family protein
MKIYYLLFSLMFIACRHEEPQQIIKLSKPSPTADKEGYYYNYTKPPELVKSFDDFKKSVVYPANEKSQRIQGKVIVMAFINEKGHVDKSSVLVGIDSALNNAAMDAVNITKFIPATLDGKPVKARLTIPILFKLDDYKLGEKLLNSGRSDYPRPYSDYMNDFDKDPEPVGGMNAIMRLVVYPKEELKNRVEGKVFVTTLIDENGNVAHTFFQPPGNMNFYRAAADAVKKVKFIPAKSRYYHKNVKSRITIPVRFKLD